MKRLAALFSRVASLCRRLAAWLRIYDVQIQLQAVIDLQALDITDENALRHLAFQHEILSSRLARMRSEYVSTYLAPGERITWRVA